MESIKRWLGWGALTLLFTGALWCLSVYGAAQTEQLYRLFLVMLPATLLGFAGFYGKPLVGDKYWLLLISIGAFLLINIALRSTLESRGYVLLALGWMSFSLVIVIAAGRLDRQRKLVLLFLLVGAFEALYGLAQALGGWDYIGGYYRGMGRVATGTLYNRSHFAGLINMLLPMALGGLFAVYSKGKRERSASEHAAWLWLALLGCAAMGVVVLLSRSRAGAVSMILTLGLMVLLLHLSSKNASRNSMGGATASILLAMILAMGGLVGVSELVAKFGSTQSALAERTTVYRDTLEMIADHPLGVGPGMYQWRFRPYQSVEGRVWYDYAHNDYLQTVAEWGLLPALLFWTFVGWRFLDSAQRFLKAGPSWPRGIRLGCAGALFSIILHSLVDFNLYIPTNWAVFCAILALSWTIGLPPRERQDRDPLRAW